MQSGITQLTVDSAARLQFCRSTAPAPSRTARAQMSTQKNTSTADTRYGAPGNTTGAAGVEKYVNSCVINIGESTAAILLTLASAPCSSPCAEGPACRDITL